MNLIVTSFSKAAIFCIVLVTFTSCSKSSSKNNSTPPVATDSNMLIFFHVGDSVGMSTIAYDANTGLKKWSFFECGCAGQPSSLVIPANGLVYFNSSDNNLHALNALTGAQVWSFPNVSRYGNTPTVDNGVLYVAGNDGYLYALNAMTGAHIWSIFSETNVGGIIGGSASVSNGVVYFTNTVAGLYAVDSATGILKWQYNDAGLTCSTTPKIGNGLVFIASDNSQIYAVDTATGVLKWLDSKFDIIEGISDVILNNGLILMTESDSVNGRDASTGALLWDIGFPAQRFDVSPYAYNGTLFVNSYIGSTGYLYALDPATGNKKWELDLLAAAEAGAAGANGVLFFSGADSIYAVDAVTGGKKWTVAAEPGANPSNTAVSSAPAILTKNGNIVIGSIGGTIN
jgi:outer membrane protein assembly factor BamB